jgi:hypothetical protein
MGHWLVGARAPKAWKHYGTLLKRTFRIVMVGSNLARMASQYVDVALCFLMKC